MAERLGRQEASVQRFLELSGDDFAKPDSRASSRTPARIAGSGSGA